MASGSARVLWRRLPTYFPSIKLQMVPLSEEATSTLMKTGHLDEVVFKTTPHASKEEIRQVLQKVYQIPVLSIHTAIFLGKRQRKGPRSNLHVQKPDYKKVWVRMLPGTLTQPECPTVNYSDVDRTPTKTLEPPAKPVKRGGFFSRNF